MDPDSDTELLLYNVQELNLNGDSLPQAGQLKDCKSPTPQSLCEAALATAAMRSHWEMRIGRHPCQGLPAIYCNE